MQGEVVAARGEDEEEAEEEEGEEGGEGGVCRVCEYINTKEQSEKQNVCMYVVCSLCGCH